MPVHLRALVVILFLATVMFALAKSPACAIACTPRDFERRRNLWLAIVLTAFLAHNFWIFIIVTATMLLFVVPRESNKLALYFFILLVVPPFAQKITGLGVINHFFEINYLRLLALAVLFPAFLELRKEKDTAPLGRSMPDKLILGFLILNFCLTFTVSSFTNTLRVGLFYGFIDIFLPYYVASRSLKNIQGFRDALMAFGIAALLIGSIGIFEASRHWLLYASLDDAMGFDWSYASYLEREGAGLRAQGSTGQPIILGYVMAVAFGFFFFLKKTVPNTTIWLMGLVAIVSGMISPLSRGPWVGAGIILLLFIATGRYPIRRLMQVGFLLGMGGIALLATPYSDKIIDLLPFAGNIEVENVTYRQQLLDIGIQVIQQNPFFGAYNFFLSEEAQALKQGNGMIDLVNTYLAVGLSNGLVGLFLYAGFFISIVASIFRAMRTLPDKDSEIHILGQTLLSTLLGILVIIFTVSSILAIPVITWSVAGLGAAYAHMLASSKTARMESKPENITALSRQSEIIKGRGARTIGIKGIP
jgi:O-antigen ligase